MNKIGRNEQCPCGSGKKYKKCCLNNDDIWQPTMIFDDNERPQLAPLLSDPEISREFHPYSICKIIEKPSSDILAGLSKSDLIKLKNKWTIPKIAKLKTETIVKRLNKLGIDACPSAFKPLTKNRTSAWSIGEVWLTEIIEPPKGNDEDFMFLAACELWKRYYPENPSEEMVDDWVSEGYDLQDAGRNIEAIATWLKVWEHINARLEPHMRTFGSVASIFRISQMFFNWIQDFEMSLTNITRTNSKYAEIGTLIICKIVEQFDKEDIDTMLNIHCDLGKVLFMSGQREESEAVFQEIIKKNPQYPHGYVSFSDELSDSDNLQQDLPQAISLLEQALAYPVEDPAGWDIECRLTDLRAELAC